MKFHALLPVRDEADIISECLAHLLTWADTIHVFDTGSVDNTWEIVQNFAANNKQVKPVKKDSVYFSENRVRGWLFHHARQQMREGDWFLRVDADEFHHISPPEFVKTRLSKCETVVWHQYYDFRLTSSEAIKLESDNKSLIDRKRPIEERRRWFMPSVYSEPRLCRYRATMQWPTKTSFPYNAGFIAKNRLPIRHYPHRDPVQLDRRCRLRAIMMADKENQSHWTQPELHHWSEREWQRFITPDHSSGLQYWQMGTELPEFNFTSHLAKPHIRFSQRLAHAFFLPFLDCRRSGWDHDAYPQPIPLNVVKQLEAEL